MIIIKKKSFFKVKMNKNLINNNKIILVKAVAHP